jgi:hypothetical protein
LSKRKMNMPFIKGEIVQTFGFIDGEKYQAVSDALRTTQNDDGRPYTMHDFVKSVFEKEADRIIAGKKINI